MAFEDILEGPGKPRRSRAASAAATQPRSIKASSPYLSDEWPILHQQARNSNKPPRRHRHRPKSSGRNSTSRRIYLRPECGRMDTTQMLSEVSFRRTTRTASRSMAGICQSDSRERSRMEYGNDSLLAWSSFSNSLVETNRVRGA